MRVNPPFDDRPGIWSANRLSREVLCCGFIRLLSVCFVPESEVKELILSGSCWPFAEAQAARFSVCYGESWRQKKTHRGDGGLRDQL